MTPRCQPCLQNFKGKVWKHIVQAWRERGYVNTERNKLKGTINKWKDI